LTDEPKASEAVESPSDPAAAAEAPGAPPKLAWWHLHRRLYNWVLHWAHTPYGTPALAILAFCEASVLPAVPPDVLLVALALSRRKRSLYYALVCSIFSVMGGIAGYCIGYALWDLFARDLFIPYIISQADYAYVALKYDENAFKAVFTAGLTPIPYIVFCVAGGVAKISFGVFLLASVISRSMRFFAVATLIWIFGPSVKRFIDKYFNWVCIAFVVLLIGGIVVTKLLMKR
jgi:membrane protein YqaA with SNARE-associated domain